MMCGPTWNSLPLPIAWDLFGTNLPPYIYEIPTLFTLGVRPAMLSMKNCRRTWSKQPGSSWVVPGKPGRQVHPLVPARRNPELATRRGWIVEHGCVLRNGNRSPGGDQGFRERSANHSHSWPITSQLTAATPGSARAEMDPSES